MSRHIVEVDVLIAPFEIVNYSLVRQFLLYYKDVLKEVNDPLFYVKMIEFSYHCFLVFKISFVLVNKGITFINYVSNVVKDGAVGAFVEQVKFIRKILVLFFLSLQLIMHIFDLYKVSLKFTNN